MLSQKHIKGLESRALSVEVATTMGIYSGRRSPDGVVREDADGDILCFPFFEHGEEVNTKYRQIVDGERRMWQRKGAVKTPYNADVILNHETLRDLENETNSLVWTEGEFDCVAAIQAGWAWTMSIPDGAMPGRDGNGVLIDVPDHAKDIDPAQDDKFAFFARHADALMLVRSHIIAMDDDDSGKRMSRELVRRLGAARCLWIKYPSTPIVPVKGQRDALRPCKDLNEVLQYAPPLVAEDYPEDEDPVVEAGIAGLLTGEEIVSLILTKAKPWPVRGLYKLSDYPDLGTPEMFDVGISDDLDEHLKLYTGAFLVATGLPGSGKSTLINQMSVNMAMRHGWPIGIFSGEAQVKPFMEHDLMTGFLGKHKSEWSFADRQRARAFVERYYCFIDHDPRGDDDEEIDIDFLITAAGSACFRYGIKMLIVDPWNELEHGKRDTNVSHTEYVGMGIKKLKRFAKSYDCLVAVVAHPKKLESGEIPSLYSVADSAHFSNKADLALIVHAPDPYKTNRTIIIPKIRFSGLAGKKGEVGLNFDLRTHLFSEGYLAPPDLDAPKTALKAGKIRVK